MTLFSMREGSLTRCQSFCVVFEKRKYIALGNKTNNNRRDLVGEAQNMLFLFTVEWLDKFLQKWGILYMTLMVRLHVLRS